MEYRFPVIKADSDRIWRKYCGFLDLNLDEFMSVQDALMVQQLKLLASSDLGRRLFCGAAPSSTAEYRETVRLTTYDDYLADLDENIEATLPERPYTWASTFGNGGSCRKVPYTREAYERALDNLMAIFILSCSRKRGRSGLAERDRVLYNVAPAPYLSGILAAGASRAFNLRPVMPPDLHDGMDFRDKITQGYEMSLRTGVDIMIAMTSVLVKTANEFNSMSANKGVLRHFKHPAQAYRVIKAYLTSKLENRPILPKDLWPIKSLIGWGIDTSIYREHIHRFWGAYPYEFHACTEGGIMGVQSWTRNGLTLIPHSNYFEFIPESEWLKCRRNVFYEPRTVLLPQVKTGQRYELVISNYYGMPFVRYRLGHLMRVTSMEDFEAGIRLPQFVFEARADDLIDIAGFTRISEKTVTQAIANCHLNFEDWTIRKEISHGKPVLHIYIETDSPVEDAELAAMLHRELTETDPGYHDLVKLMEIHPLTLTRLVPGSFSRYYEEKQQQGLALGLSRPPRVNAPDSVIEELTGLLPVLQT